MKRIVSLIVALVIVLPCGVAYAEGDGGGHSFGSGDWAYGIVQGPRFIPNHDSLLTNSWGWIIYAPNKYDAALYVCGMEPSEVSSVTAEQRAKLSNASTGGAFFDLASHIYKVGDGSIPTWADASMIRALFTAEDVDYVYRLEVDDMQAVEDAKADLQTILDGGDLGGGGGGSVENIPSGYTLLNGGSYSGLSYTYSAINTNYVNSIVIDWSGTNITQFSDLSPCAVGHVISSNSTSYNLQCAIYYVPDGVYCLMKNDKKTFYLWNTTDTTQNVKMYYKYGVNVNLSTYSGNVTGSLGNPDNVTVNANSLITANIIGIIDYCSTLQGASSVPPSQWPGTEPETPTQPIVPSPTIISITIASQPTFYYEPTTITTNNYTSTTYDGTDYGKQLKSIYDELKAFHVDNNTGLNSVLRNFGEVVDGISALGTDLDEQVNWLADSLKIVLNDNFRALKTYMKELFEWLADEMDFTVSGGGYNDSTVVSWLKKIWSKMGSGWDSRPVDPVTEPDGFIEWLNNLVIEIWSRIAALGSELAEDVADVVAGILLKFPFSVPWDVMAMLGLLAAEPVTPSVDYTVPMGPNVQVRLKGDLHWLDSSIGVIKSFELLAFCVYLATKTPDVISIPDQWNL